MSIGDPDRQMTRVPRRSGTLARISSSISTLSRSARTTRTGLRRLSLAMLSSLMIVKMLSDQPRITAWSRSSTTDRPRRRSASLVSIPAAITPIRALTMNRPPMVSASIVRTNRQAPPSSPATVPGSSACSRLENSSSKKPLSSLSRRPRAITRSENTKIMTNVPRVSQAISAGVPRDIVLSKK